MTNKQRHILWMAAYDCQSKGHETNMAHFDIAQALTMDMEACDPQKAWEAAKRAAALSYEQWEESQALLKELEKQLEEME